METPQRPLQVFTTLLLSNTLLNYDTGVIPASLPELQQSFTLSYHQQASIGSLVYIGLCISSFAVSPLLHRYSAQKILTLSLSLNSLFCVLLSLSQNIYSIYIARLGMGFTQAFVVIYSPVWTNQFAPCSACTRWLGILQCSVPLGVVLGYSVGSFCSYYSGDVLNWRSAIFLQACLEVPLIVRLGSFRPTEVDLPNPDLIVSSGELSDRQKVRIDSISLSNFHGFFVQFQLLIQNFVFIYLTLSLCCLFFVVSGIQYWVSLYMIDVLQADRGTVVLGFILISTTAPIFGVLTGGCVADYFGGYKGSNMLKAIKICVFFGLMANFTALPAGCAQNVWIEVTALWFLLFFGGCVVPSAVGIIVNSVPRDAQSSASAFSQFIFNLFGYFLAPVLSALIMDFISEKKVALKVGFRFVLSFSSLSLILVVLVYWKILKKEFLKVENQEISVNDESAEELQHEMALRIKPLSIG